MAWKIQDIVESTGELLTSHILFIHARSGCDTTSATYGQGKTFLLKRFNKESEELPSIFSNSQISVEEVGKTSSHVFVILYGGKREESLNSLRYYKYMDVVASNSMSLDPQKLPPTERAAYYHDLRIHLQIILWKTLANSHEDLDPQQWGWRLDWDVLSPIMTDLDAAPENLHDSNVN